MELINSYSTCPSLIELIGLLYLIYWLVYKPIMLKVQYFRNNCFAALTSTKILTPNHGDYAVITGATSGIGLEYARQLAEKGYNLLLLSRSEEKLKQIADEIHEMYSQTKNVFI